MLYERNVQVPKACPLCPYEFWRGDGHLRVDAESASESFEGHDFRRHRGLLRLIARQCASF
ncbi:hypothetical protein [Sphaerisporangium aureirubrum]|uniref:Uncharacterized protein n=1 Tax=Sphaerisporangium aureirubrum TaxID=1544736 RepID=A0ABW1NCT3_9ACTN